MECISDGLPFPELASALPIADQRSLSGLSDSEIRSWTVARADDYRKFALTLLAIHNSIAPIHRFPNELLSHIFAHSWYGRSSLRLAHVCRRWRQVLLATPEFWYGAVQGMHFDAVSDYCVPSAYFATIMMRSSPLPVQPTFARFSATLSRNLEAHLWRITALTVHAETTDEVAQLHWTLLQGLPVLTKLVVQYSPHECDCARDGPCQFLDNTLYVDPLPADALPCLEQVELPGFLFDKVAVPSLRRVQLGRDPEGPDHDNPPIPDMEDFMFALAKCPNLLTLQLTTVLPHPDSFRTLSPDVHAVVFPTLQRFIVEDGARPITAFMPYIGFPPSVCVHIENDNQGFPDVAAEPGLRDWLRTRLLDVVADVERIDVQAEHSHAVVRCYVSGEERLHVKHLHGLQSDDFQGLAIALRSNRSLAELRWKSPDIRGGRDSQDDLSPLLRALQHLTSLTVSGCDVERALDALRVPEDNPAGEVVCPLLERLALSFPSPRMYMGPDYSTRKADAEEAAAALLRRCTQIQPVIERRAVCIGSRLTHLDFDDSLRIEDNNSSFRTISIDEASPLWGSVQPALQALQDLVDGHVVFGGLKKSWFT
ncbi:hypothetical protein C8T65DRAFT_48911 [Cerioporus squamosus]|nr:hypothetical protein C8T65DRAFT_48911 [Cerioporus squamosus]